MAEKVSTLVLNVDLQCSRCYKKVKKTLTKFPEIQVQIFDEKQNTVKISVPFCCPHKFAKKLRCKAGKSIKSIEIIEDEKTKDQDKTNQKQTDNEKEKKSKDKITPDQTPPVESKPPIFVVGIYHGPCCYGGGPCSRGCGRPLPCYDDCKRPLPCYDGCRGCSGQGRRRPLPLPLPWHDDCERPLPCYDGCRGCSGEGCGRPLPLPLPLPCHDDCGGCRGPGCGCGYEENSCKTM